MIDQALIRRGADQPAVSLGMSVTVYFSGVMAMSMPPQISAVHIVLPTVEGVASSVSDTGFLLTTASRAFCIPLPSPRIRRQCSPCGRHPAHCHVGRNPSRMA